MIKTYDDMQISIIRMTERPGDLVQLACSVTMKQHFGIPVGANTTELIRYLIDADHGNPLEHVYFTFQLMDLSRSFLAQITRHRIGSFTSSSQHYQDYRDYPMIIDSSEAFSAMIGALERSIDTYEELIETEGSKPEEARQVLPNAMAINLLWTVNAVSLANFFRKRMCNRNVKEMRMAAERIWDLVNSVWPEYACNVGPDCYSRVKCRQGKMQCKERRWESAWYSNE